ncbi:hypothetical protein [Ferrovum sp.]|uniref:hypothetical protein n=1 Tax=Ferrovum sp. TaxID=2609467 RepID=UPI0026257916|nr:hypothetical protein [Ferrovum sp.]
MKAKFTTDPAGHVSLEYDDTDYDGVTRRITRVFLAPLSGGYVREYLEHGKSSQVCERLSSTGITLSVTSREKLLDLIRKEYRAMCRSEKKQQNPWS